MIFNKVDKLEELRHEGKTKCDFQELQGILEFFELHSSEVEFSIYKDEENNWLIKLT